ncbi:MAG: hypothetical protein QXS76_03190, partial [Candidatus Bathyarchaeia archaeon]
QPSLSNSASGKAKSLRVEKYYRRRKRKRLRKWPWLLKKFLVLLRMLNGVIQKVSFSSFKQGPLQRRGHSG